MYKTFTLPLKSAFSLAAFFILTACGGFTIDLDSLVGSGNCLANPFESECDNDKGIAEYRKLITDDCNANPEKSNTVICTAADNAANPSDNENGATGAEDADNTPKNTEVKIEFDKNSFTKTDKEKGKTTSLEIVDLCSDPATAGDKQCTLAVVNCINNPFSGRCQGDNVLGNFVRDGVTVSKTVVLQDKRVEDCRVGRIDRALCQNLNVQKARCAGAAFSTDTICSAVAHSVCKADAFDPLCGEKEDFQGVYFSERSYVCFEDPNNPNCKGANGHVAVVCSEYPFDRLCTGNADYDDARANACEVNPTISSSCPVVEPEEEGTGLEITVNVCLNNPFDSTCVGLQYDIDRTNIITTCVLAQIVGRRTAQCDAIFDEARPCLINPFDSACDGNDAIGTYIGLLRSTRVTFCNSSLRIASYCTGVPVPVTTPVGEITTVASVVPATSQVTAKVWADSFDTPLAHGATTTDTDGKFLIGRETDLDTGGVDALQPSYYYNSGNLNFADATFNGVALGGDAEDGMAFFASHRSNSYVGILEGTNLGAPLTDTTGSAKWVGSFTYEGTSLIDFILNVSFGAGDGAGEIEARVKIPRYIGYHLTGEFNDAGVITGTAWRGYSNNNTQGLNSTGKLTGLIGEEGAVGAFIIKNSYGSQSLGGFVARPSSADELRTLAQTCADDPFHKHCNIGYEDERDAIFDHCIIGGNANDESCGSIRKLHRCIEDPFQNTCRYKSPEHYQQMRANRKAFCRTEGNADNALCTVPATYQNICRNYPFDAQCLGDNRYTPIRRTACTDNPFARRCAGEGYNDLRVSFCERNAGNPACPRPQPSPNRVTTADWLASFDTPLRTQSPIRLQNNGYRHWDQFLKSTAWGLDTSGLEVLNLTSTSFANATFDGQSLGGDALGGVYSLRTYLNGLINNFASVHSDTDLGAPLTAAAGTKLIWHGTFQSATRNYSGNRRGFDSHTQDFDLEINFGAGNKVGTVEAFVKKNRSDFDNTYFHLKGEFDANGVIDGTVKSGYFQDHDRLRIVNDVFSSYSRGSLSGLIGQKGAVGVIQGNTGAAGFVATPNARYNPNVRHSDWANSFDVGVLHNFASRTNEGNPAFFVRGDKTGIHSPFNSLSGVHFAPNFLENTLDFSDINPALDSADKVSYVATAQSFGRAGRFTGRVGHAAGIWSTTDLGLPLVTRPADANGNPHKATWGGKLGLIVNAQLLNSRGGGTGLIPTRDIGLVVDYTNQTIHNTSTIDGAHQIVLNGRWTNNADNSQNGVISGDITYNPAPSATGSTAYAGVVKGIIGQEGAVGAFVRDGTGFDYVGGFIAHPSAVFVPPPAVDTNPNRVTAADWVASFDEPLSHGASLDDTEDQFLIGKETELDTGDVGVSRYSPPMSLNLADATFNGVALGGDRADGVAFFAAGRANDGGRYDYAGVLSGTNLGAPLTNTTRFAKWIGSFNHIYDPQTNTDFVLNISFGTAIDGSPEIEALIQRPGVWESDYYLKGTFDAAGVITGTVRSGYFRTNNPNNRGQAHNSRSRVTGLIGEQGAVGVFINDIEYDGYSGSFGGFVARPPSADELRTLTQTCVDDPFNQRCTVGYDAERIAHFERCITGGNANDASCDSAKKLYLCINDPFRFNCRHLPQYSEQVRAKRVAFCRIPGSGDNELCTVESTYRHVCRNYPFTAQCLGDYNYSPLRREACSIEPFARRCLGEGYNDLRVAFCDRAVNANNPSCPRPVVPTTTPTPNRVTAADWVASFETAPLTVPTSYGSQFLQGNKTKLNPGPLFPNVGWMTSRTFADRGYGLINDGTGGYAYFRGYAGPSRGYTAHYYAGILSNTDLGAPLTQTSGSVYWKGDASYGHSNGSGADRSMILKVTFGNDGQGNAGRVNSTINADLIESRFDLEGVFDHQGVISGTATLIRNETTAWRNKQAGTQISGVLSGLIGQKGAVGAFHGKRKATDTAVGTFGGGFVAVANFVNVNPVTPDWVTTEDWVASFSPGLATTPNDRNKNHFLKGTQTGLNTGEYTNLGAKPTVYSLTLADVTLNGQATDGAAFFKGGVEASNTREIELGGYAYAGILSDTDLGAPLTRSSGTAHWQGKFLSVFNNKNTVDSIKQNFTLEISFDNAGSGNAGKITAVIDATTDTTTDTEFEIDGVFNSQGVISGVVSTIRTLPFPDGSLSDNRYRNRGLLTGLIGEQGAVGAFVSPPHIRSGFVGAFVAVPNFVDVTPTPNQVAWADRVGRTINKHPEVLTGTDLGAPLTQTTGSVSWNGAFRSGDSYYRQRDFVLRITFGGQEHAGTLSGYVQKDLLGQHYLVEGYFDENGVIGGTVAEWSRTTYSVDTPNPILTNDSQKDIKLTGLIGSRGAIATFNRGGFVASPDIGLSPEVTDRDWLESFNGKVLTIDGTRNDPGLGAFIQGASRGTLTFTPTTLDFVMIDGVPNTNPGDVGVIFHIELVDGQMRHYAGVLRGTRLGDPLTVLPADTNGNPATATWNGHLGMIANSGAIHRRDIDLSVDFTNQTINHSSVLNTGLKSISLDGTWADNGVIDGTITYDPNPVPNAVNARDGVVRGLIGQYGAVGAFISNNDVTDMPFAGGFVATPPSQ